MIRVISIDPVKNSKNISVNKDLEIKIVADFKLDPRDVSFALNDVTVVPNIFSAYNGNTSYELTITLYTKRRVKYGSERKYGDDDLRYGKRDDRPSMLEYASRYVCQFTVWGINTSGAKETLTDSFVFTTEDGIFYNSNPPTYFYSDATQGLANYFPEWSKTRYDKYSNTQQLLNPIGEQLERIQDFVKKEKMNSAIQTTNLNELNQLFRIELDKDFEIKSLLNEDGSFFYIPPSISAIQGITRFDLFTTQENSLKSFYNEKLPTRIDATRIIVNNNTLVERRLAKEIKELLDVNLERLGSVCLYIHGLKSSITKTISQNIVPVKCRLYGVGLFDNIQDEDILLFNEHSLISRKEWKTITDIEFFNLPNYNIEYEICHFRKSSTPIMDIKEITTFEDTKESIIWSHQNYEERTLIQRNITIGENNAEVLRNAGATVPVQETELLDIDNRSPLSIIDIAPDRFSNMIYAIDRNFLYIFDKREPYSKKLKEIPGDNGLADFIIELDDNEMGLDENNEKEILFKCVHKRPGKTILRYRLKIKQPDGTIYFIKENNERITDSKQATINISQRDIVLDEHQYSTTLNQVGDYIIELETVYKGGYSSSHKQLVRILSTGALVKYRLERILGDQTPVTLFFDNDQRLKIFTKEDNLHSLELKRDGVLIDYENKTLYFSENYSSVDVE